ncbi:MAG: substrate-binding domain-containing protein, partial [Candidatus Thermoplasmatota archaeon]|nr:substrate-binding domain-containing protein [Candidatus Thermoplasmatota archaeon]
MKATNEPKGAWRFPVLALAIMLLAGALAGCVSQNNSGQGQVIQQAGSSTVFPIAEAWAEELAINHGVQVSVAGGGSGAGASKICAGEIDIGD